CVYKHGQFVLSVSLFPLFFISFSFFSLLFSSLLFSLTLTHTHTHTHTHSNVITNCCEDALLKNPPEPKTEVDITCLINLNILHQLASVAITCLGNMNILHQPTSRSL